MRTRVLAVIGCVLFVLGLIAAGAYLLSPRKLPTRADFEKVQPGMTRAEVEALLGGPPDGHFVESSWYWHLEEGHGAVYFDGTSLQVEFAAFNPDLPFQLPEPPSRRLFEKRRTWARE